MRNFQPIPIDPGGEPSESGYFARAIAETIGPAYQPAAGTIVLAEFLALGDTLSEAQDGALDGAIAEAFVDTATQMLSELEEAYGVNSRPDLTDAERRSVLVAKIRAQRGGTPQAILAAVRTYDASATIYETTTQDVASPYSMRFAVHIPTSTLDDLQKWREIKELVRGMAPAHTVPAVSKSIGFFTDDPDCLTDRDCVGA